MESENRGDSGMSVAMEFAQRLDKEVAAERRVGDLLLEKLVEITSWQEENPGESRDVVKEVAQENDLSLRYVQHVFWGLEGAAMISVSGGRVSLVERTDRS